MGITRLKSRKRSESEDQNCQDIAFTIQMTTQANSMGTQHGEARRGRRCITDKKTRGGN
jgi:hypothetical protein